MVTARLETQPRPPRTRPRASNLWREPMLRSIASVFTIATLVGCARPAAHHGAAADPAETAGPADRSSALEAERSRGESEARARIAAGSYALLVPSAVPVPWMHRIRVEEYARFGIDYELTGDTYSESFEAYRAGFNRVMTDALKRRHGEEVLERIRDAIDRRLRDEAPDSTAT